MENYRLKRSTLPGLALFTVLIGILFFVGIVFIFGFIGYRIALAQCEGVEMNAVIRESVFLAVVAIAGAVAVLFVGIRTRISNAKILLDGAGVTRKIFGMPQQQIKWEAMEQCGIFSYRAGRVAIPYMAFFSRYKLPDEALSGAINGEYFSKWPEIICVGLETEKEATALKEFCALHGKTLEDHRKEPRPKPF